jgi:SAM-dependent methyltransferase
MYYRLKTLARLLTPPLLAHGADALLNAAQKTLIKSGGRDAEWYDRAFRSSTAKHRPYYECRLFFLWAVIAYIIAHDRVNLVLEVGCGSGRLSQLLRDTGVKTYCGIDFSLERIEWARKQCPEFRFVHADVLKTDLFETFDYDAVVCAEFLEHIEQDLEVISKIRSGARFIGTVPNFPYASHVRHFRNQTEVSRRYAPYFRDFRVCAFLADRTGRKYFLFEGIRI